MTKKRTIFIYQFITKMDNNELTIVAQQTGLPEPKSISLMQSFAGYFQEAKKLVAEYGKIEVTDESQKADMLAARETRLKLKDIRIAADKTRVELKEQSLREGRAIDGIANVIKALIVPAEEYLEKQEKFAENKEKERLEKAYESRVNELLKYVTDVSLYNIKEMADEVFANLLAGCKANWDKAQEEIKEAEVREKQRIALEQIKQERRVEFAPYQQFIDIGDKLIGDLTDEDYKDVLEKAKTNKKTYEDNQERIRQENLILQDQAKEKEKEMEAERLKQAEDLKKANEEKEKAEAKLRQEKEAQLKKEADEKAAQEAKQKEEDEAKRKALLAPDKEKILKFAEKFMLIQAPAVESMQAQELINLVGNELVKISNLLIEGAKKL